MQRYSAKVCCRDAYCGEVNSTLDGATIIPVGSGTPLWSNVSNPLNHTLRKDDCWDYLWWMNATGPIWTSHDLRVYTNVTWNMTIANSTDRISIMIEPWLSSDWWYRRNITIDHTKVPQDQTDFPVWVHLDSDNFNFARCMQNGYDVRFTDMNGVLLPYEFEDWNPAGQTADIWVKAPMVSSVEDTLIFMYYGNPAATDGQDLADLWSNGFEAVWHFNRSLRDSTTHGFDLTGFNGPTYATGKIGGCINLDDASSQYAQVEEAVVNMWPLTFSTWFKSDDAALTQSMLFIGARNLQDRHYATLSIDGADAARPVIAQYKPYPIADQINGTSTAGYSSGTWHLGHGVFFETTP
jgi:hypothetical protein